MAIEARNRPLPDWFTRIRTRQTVLPRFQRFEAWGHGRVTQIFNTIIQDLPVGAVLVLEVGDIEPFISRPLEGAPATGERVTEHLLDGQQRLTALWRGFNNNYEDRTYFLVLEENPETGIDHYVDSIGRWRKDGDQEARPFWANQPWEQWQRRMVPLDLCSPELDSPQRFRTWARSAVEGQDERDRLSDTVAVIRQKFASFNLPFLSLPVTTKRDVALDVFIKMNTAGVALTVFDIIVAQVEAGMGTSLHDLIAGLRAACPLISEYYPPEDLVLYAGALLQGRPPTNATYMSKEFGPRLLNSWEALADGVRRATTFLADEHIFDAPRLPTDVVVPVLVALWSIAPKGLDGEGRARNILRKYIWRAFFSNRYESSTNSRAFADYNDLMPLISGSGDSNPAIFDDAQHPLPQPQELIGAGWPKQKDRLARAVLAIALKRGGADLADGAPVSRENLQRREYHHLFPDAYLKRKGVPDDRIYRSVNCALVTWNTNRNISDKDPEHYLAERLAGTDLGESEVRGRLSSHLIPYDEMIAGDYDTFLSRRAELIHDAMLKLCETGATSGG
jgi:hypothetical protein